MEEKESCVHRYILIRFPYWQHGSTTVGAYKQDRRGVRQMYNPVLGYGNLSDTDKMDIWRIQYKPMVVRIWYVCDAYFVVQPSHGEHVNMGWGPGAASAIVSLNRDKRRLVMPMYLGQGALDKLPSFGEDEGNRMPSFTEPEEWERERQHKDMTWSFVDAVMCCVCEERTVNCITLPCFHWQMCFHCMAHVKKCPMCRAVVTDRLPLHTKPSNGVYWSRVDDATFVIQGCPDDDTIRLTALADFIHEGHPLSWEEGRALTGLFHSSAQKWEALAITASALRHRIRGDQCVEWLRPLVHDGTESLKEPLQQLLPFTNEWTIRDLVDMMALGRDTHWPPEMVVALSPVLPMFATPQDLLTLLSSADVGRMDILERLTRWGRVGPGETTVESIVDILWLFRPPEQCKALAALLSCFRVPHGSCTPIVQLFDLKRLPQRVEALQLCLRHDIPVDEQTRGCFTGSRDEVIQWVASAEQRRYDQLVARAAVQSIDDAATSIECAQLLGIHIKDNADQRISVLTSILMAAQQRTVDRIQHALNSLPTCLVSVVTEYAISHTHWNTIRLDVRPLTGKAELLVSDETSMDFIYRYVETCDDAVYASSSSRMPMYVYCNHVLLERGHVVREYDTRNSILYGYRWAPPAQKSSTP